ncbi:hypothetical protein PHYBOEH_010398 [Phytophthora boehmeriae]|uniref:Uncharacterized protein n=1 Tax=Phytophthora boehmeriae TaxID=109152 RepID=A0A8T1VRI8_9STRA|nr:hypothetical protein PHYBOEH_010398 [Phytophthora boehmeriae]
MLNSKVLLAIGAFAMLAAKIHADDYSDDYNEGSSYSDEGTSYSDEGSSYSDEGTSYSDEGTSYSDESTSYYSDDASYYEEDQGSSYYSGDSSYDGEINLPAYVYKFDPEYSAGVSGNVTVHYAGPFSTFATIAAHLDFSAVDASAITAFDGNCSGEVTDYKWHIHVKWPNENDSESFEKCALGVTGNHYDPLKACGPNSEFVGTEDCLLKTPEYDCNPDDYAWNPLVCEKGDLSGKFGDFKLDENKQVCDEWYDPNYPLPEENTPEWSIILHAVCGKVTPRIACAVGKEFDGDY